MCRPEPGRGREEAEDLGEEGVGACLRRPGSGRRRGLMQEYLQRLGLEASDGFPDPRDPKALAGSVVAPDWPIDTDSEDSATSSDASPTALLSGENFRARYLQRLASSRAWIPRAQRPPKHQTVIIFDWDDTLLCTSWLLQQEGKPVSLALQQHLRDIGRIAQQLLELASTLGHTFIITNAKTGWVEHSAAKWVPELLPAIEQVRVISARDGFEKNFPTDINRWKIETFLEVQRELDSTVITNLIALGDSTFEMDAARAMFREFEEALLKTIKFQQGPTPAELLKQVELVHGKLKKIVETARNMKIHLERRPGQ